MERLREGWWLMIVVCVASGLWFFAMPLLGYGYIIDGVSLRPGWMGIPPCLFGAVYAARTTSHGWLSGVLSGVALFIVTLLAGVQFWVMQLSHLPQCALWGEATSCRAIDTFDEAHERWEPGTALRDVKSPRDSRTFVERAW